MECPKCKGVKLEKKDPSKPYWCPTCGGVWVSMDNLSSQVDEEVQDGVFNHEDYDGKTGLCPAGHGIMIRAGIEGDYPFYLERCTTCGGVWFDHGEWQQIAKHHLLDNLTDHWTSAWQRRTLHEKEREAFIELHKKRIGDDIVHRILDLAALLKDHPQKARAMALLKQETA